MSPAPKRRPAPPAPVVPISAPDPAALSGDVKLEEFVLDGRKLDLDITERVTDWSVKSTIEGASTLTLVVRDSDGKVRRSRIFKDKKAVYLDAVGLEWALAGASKTGRDLTLTFEDRRVAGLRRHRKQRKVTRAKNTRAEFVKMLVDEVDEPRIVFVCPELHKRQPIAKSTDHETRDEKDSRRGKGLADKASLHFRADPRDATPAQLRLAERVLDIAASLDSPERAALALAEAVINETAIKNVAFGDRTSLGVLQVLDSTARSVGIDPMDVEQCVRAFLLKGFTGAGGAIKLAQDNPHQSPGWIAGQVMNLNVSPDFYGKWGEEARALLDAYGGISGDGERSITVTKPFEFSRGKPGGPKRENTWQCALRLADEVGWRRFMVGKRFYFISEEDLIRSRPRATVNERSPGVDSIDYDVDGRHQVDEMTITARAALWKVPPGAVVMVKDEDPFVDGRWLVATVSRTKGTSTASTIECRRGAALLQEKKEPAPESETKTIGGGAGSEDADGLIDWAKGTLGTVEGSRKQQMWAASFGLSASLPWCSIWIGFGLKRVAGLELPANPAYSGAWLGWSGGKHVSLSDVKAGDIVVFDWGDGGRTDHVALYVGSGDVIGGNQSNKVSRVPLNRGAVVGVVRPRYR